MKRFLAIFTLVLSIIMGQIAPISWAEVNDKQQEKNSETNVSEEYDETQDSNNYVEVQKGQMIGTIIDYENAEVFNFQFKGVSNNGNYKMNFTFDEYCYKDEIYNYTTTIEFFIKLGDKMEYIESKDFELSYDVDKHISTIDKIYFEDQEYIYARIGKSMDKEDDYYCGTLLFKVLNPYYKGGGEVINIPDKKLHKAINERLFQDEYTPVTRYKMSQVKELDLSELEVENLEGLQYCENLENLNLANSKTKDFKVISNLKNLKVLDLSNNNISDISILNNLTSLTKLYLKNNNINDVSNLKNLNKLTVLNLERNKISNISSLEGLSSLTNLNVGSNNISDISVVKNLTNLKYFRGSQNKITDISPLGKLKNLKELNLSTQRIDLGPILIKDNKFVFKNPLIGMDGKPIAPSKIGNGGKYSKTTNNITWDYCFYRVDYRFSHKLGVPGTDYTGDFYILIVEPMTNFTVKSINKTATTITGTGVPYSTVEAYLNNKKIGTTVKVDSRGNFIIKNVKGIKAGDKVVVKISQDGYESKQKTVTVLDTFNTFTVNSITTKSKTIEGKGLKEATVKAYIDGKQIGKTVKVTSSGTYKITDVKNLKKGKKVEVKISKLGYVTTSKTVTIK